jgi:hypothetical protein
VAASTKGMDDVTLGADDEEHEYVRIARELGALPEMESIQRVRVHERNYLTFASNYDELRKSLDVHRGKGTGIAELWHVGNRDGLFQLQCEVSRLLHNFLASASSLIDTTRVLYGRCGKGRFPDYQARVDSDFKSNGLARFVVCLRQYALHYSALPIVSHLNIADGKVWSIVQLERAEIDAYSSWDAHAKGFLAGCPGQIDLEPVVEQYFANVRQFYEWFYRRMSEVLEPEVAIVGKKLEELRRCHYSLAEDFLSVGLSLYKRGFGSPDDIYRQAIPPDERTTISSEPSPAKRCEVMIELVKSRATLSDELVEGIRECFRDHHWE